MPAGARTLEEEGIVLPPTRLTPDVERAFLARVRTPDVRRGDLAAQRAATAKGVEGMFALVARYGWPAVRAAVRDLIGAAPPAHASTATPTLDGLPPLATEPECDHVRIDVTDPERAQMLVVSREPGQSPVTRVIEVAGTPTSVACETVAQVVRGTLRALRDADANRRTAGDGSALASAAEGPPPTELTSTAARNGLGARATTERSSGPAYSAVISLGQHSFPFFLGDELGPAHIPDAVAASVERQRGWLVLNGRLSGEWAQAQLSGSFHRLTTQIISASSGAAALAAWGRVRFSVGVEVGVIVMHQNDSLTYAGGPQAIVYSLPGVAGNSWSAGPLAAFRGTLDVDVSPRIFLRLDAGLPWVVLRVRDAAGNDAWHRDGYAQLLLGAGYRL